MVRARDAVLGLLAVSFGSAGRFQNTQKATSAADVINMLAEHIGTKGKTANTQVLGTLRELGQETPGLEQSLNDLLAMAIQDIQANVSSPIVAAHHRTNEEITLKISALDAATQTAVAQKTIADQDDNAWFACVGDEKAARKAVEDADAALVQARGEVEEPCRQQEERRSFSAAEPTPPVFEDCDVSLQGNCDAQVENFQSQVNSILESLKLDLAADQASYIEAKERCDAANANVVSKESALEAANEAFSSQKALCSQKHETRSLNLCLFGTDLQAKCEAVTNYERIFLDTFFRGNDNSHVDRQAEWKTAETSICVLNKVIGGRLGTEVIDECEQAIDYERDVGVLDKQESRFEELTTVEMFTCQESNISFIGETWVGFTDATASTDYMTEPYHPEVNLAVGSPPFSFCGGAPAPPPQEDTGPGKPTQ